MRIIINIVSVALLLETIIMRIIINIVSVALLLET